MPLRPRKRFIPPVPAPANFIDRGGGYDIAYSIYGPADGRPLLIVHGLAASGLQFVSDADWFAKNGFRVIVPDLRGHGRSRCPRERRDEDFALDALADDMLAVLDREAVSATDWVGNSLGGILALDLMGRAPERLGRVVTFGTALRLEVPRAIIDAGHMGVKLTGPELAAAALAPLTSRVKSAQALLSHVAARIDADAVRRTAYAAGHYDFRRNAAGFNHPFMMIQGKDDALVNRALAPDLPALAGKPNFLAVNLPNAGHCANLDQPEAMRGAILDFLRAPEGN